MSYGIWTLSLTPLTTGCRYPRVVRSVPIRETPTARSPGHNDDINSVPIRETAVRSPGQDDDKKLTTDFEAYARRLRIQYIFRDKAPLPHDPFRQMSKRPFTSCSNEALEHYISETRCLMGHILHNNVFEFNDHYFAQVKGTTMGTKMAPAYAGLFMARLEEDILAAQEEETHNSLVLWKRYIDDIVAIWRGDKASLLRFLDRLDNSDPHIKYTWTVDSSRMNYLDVDAFKGHRFDETGFLDTRTHIKETNSFQYVQASSSYPPLSSRGF